MPTTIPLWKTTSDSDPRVATSLTFYPCEKAGAQDVGCIMVCPGGGYGGLAAHEGEPIALWLNSIGLHAAVLRYRVAPNRHPAMINDAQRGLRLLRGNTQRWNIDTQSIGVLGFSAGGHLASTLATHFNNFTCADDDLAPKISARPDVAILCYPVIDLADRFAHKGSGFNLLGQQPDSKMIALLSNHMHVTSANPPTFLWHTSDDAGVPVENSFMFASACHQNGVPVEVHSYESGRHGLGLAKEVPDVAPWTDACARFLLRHLKHA